MPRQIRLNAFDMNCVAHQSPGLWMHPRDQADRDHTLENSHYEPETGQLLAASFMDYGVPRADMLPFLATALSEIPTPTNRLGIRSGGDALSELGVRHIEMPATPERVWAEYSSSYRAEGLKH